MNSLMFVFPLIIGVISHPDVSELSGYNYNNPASSNAASLKQPSGSYLPTSGKLNQPTGSYIPPASGSGGYNDHNPLNSNAASLKQPTGSYLPTSGKLQQPTGSYIPPPSGSGGYNYNNPSSNIAEPVQPSTSYIPARATPEKLMQLSGSYLTPSSNNYNNPSQSGYNYNNPSQQRFTQPTGSYIPPSQPAVNYLPSAQSSYNTQPSGNYISPSNQNSAIHQQQQPSGSYLPSDQQHSGNLAQQQDQKHVYYFAAPDEEEQARFRINIAPSNQKNTRIIFVKAPSSGGVVPEVIQPPSQAEDKTLVYVLVKKPQQDQGITIPASSGVKQAKPEVYFIKYKNHHDAEQAVSESLVGRAAGSNLPDLGNEGAFINSIKESLQKSGNLEDLSGNGGGSPNHIQSGGYAGPTNLLNGGRALSNNYGPPSGSGPY